MKQIKTCIRDFYLTTTIPIACYNEFMVEFNQIDKRFFGLYCVLNVTYQQENIIYIFYINGKDFKENDPGEPGQEIDKYIH